jgi:hypothetical protein
VLTGLLDRSALYGVLAEIEALGLDLLEIQRLTPGAIHQNQVTAAHRDGRYRRARPFRYEKLPLHDQCLRARPAIHGTSQLANGRESVMSTTAVEIPGYVAGTYTIDPGHSDVAFTARHLMVSKVRGHFTRFEGQLTLAPDPLASSVTATIELASIDTNNPQRDGDLRSANFFETDTYPTMTFRSTGIRYSEDGFDVSGELTLHG